MKTCVDGIKHGTRIGRSWGAGLKYEKFNLNGFGGPTQAEYDMKPEVDVAGNLVITKVANVVTVVNTFIAKYVGDLRLDYLLLGGECKISRLEPSTWGFDGTQELIEGICGMICLGPASDCVGTTNGMSYQQGVEGEVVCFTWVADDGVTLDEHDYELQSVGGIILLGRSCSYSPLYRKRL